MITLFNNDIVMQSSVVIVASDSDEERPHFVIRNELDQTALLFQPSLEHIFPMRLQPHCSYSDFAWEDFNPERAVKIRLADGAVLEAVRLDVIGYISSGSPPSQRRKSVYAHVFAVGAASRCSLS